MNTENTITQYRVNDVYSFRYNEDEMKKRFEPYHCFDGQLIVKEYGDSLRLVDTYWGYGDNKTFRIEDAEKLGTLTFKCNLDEVEDVSPYLVKYYANEDVFDLSTQHSCHKRFAIRKGAQRSQAKMLESIQYKIEEAKSAKASAEWNINRLTDAMKLIEAGDTTICF